MKRQIVSEESMAAAFVALSLYYATSAWRLQLPTWPQANAPTLLLPGQLQASIKTPGEMCFRLRDGCTGQCPHPLHLEIHGDLFGERTEAVLICERPRGTYIRYDRELCPRRALIRDHASGDSWDFDEMPVYCDECTDLDERLARGEEPRNLLWDEAPQNTSDSDSNVAFVAEDTSPDLVGPMEQLTTHAAEKSQEDSSSDGLFMDPGLASMSREQRLEELGRRLPTYVQTIGTERPDQQHPTYPPGPTFMHGTNDRAISSWQNEQQHYYTNTDRLRMHYNNLDLQQAADFTSHLTNPQRAEYDPDFFRDYRNQYGYNSAFIGQYDRDQDELAHTEAMSSTQSVPQDPNLWSAEYQQWLETEYREGPGQEDFSATLYGEPQRSRNELYGLYYRRTYGPA